MMDYQTLGLGAATSVVTAVTVGKNEHSITVSCIYDPQDTQMPYTLCFKQCEHIVWQSCEKGIELPDLDAELIGISLATSDLQQRTILTTDVFELSFVAQGFVLETSTAVVYSMHSNGNCHVKEW